MNRKYLFALVAAIMLGGASIDFASSAAPTGSTTTQVFDTSGAVEASYSCLTGGCHETNAKLLNDYKASYMTHVMVKCNTCHGTHTAAEVGRPKPNLTGYYPGIGAVGYVVGKDRCIACHSSALANQAHPSNPGECLSCHAPHIFPAKQ